MEHSRLEHMPIVSKRHTKIVWWIFKKKKSIHQVSLFSYWSLALLFKCILMNWYLPSSTLFIRRKKKSQRNNPLWNFFRMTFKSWLFWYFSVNFRQLSETNDTILNRFESLPVRIKFSQRTHNSKTLISCNQHDFWMWFERYLISNRITLENYFPCGMREMSVVRWDLLCTFGN